MTTTLTGTDGDLSQKRVALIVSDYHRNITDKLLAGGVDALVGAGVPENHLTVLRVPGSFELPLAASVVIEHQRPDAVICLGCVIRGETTHDQHINTSVSTELGGLSTRTSTPLGFGLLTCNTVAQALARCGGEVGNKGTECAAAVIQMMRLLDSVN